MQKSAMLAERTLLLVGVLIATSLTHEAFAEIPKANSDVADEIEVARIHKAWDETREFMGKKAKGEAPDSDDPEHRYAPEFFQYWIDHKRTDTGRRAVETAFAMWGNAGDVGAIQEAVKRIELDSPVWAHVIGAISNAYERQGHLEEFVSWLDPIVPGLADKPSQSRAYVLLGMVLEHHREQKRAREYYERVVSLRAEASDVKVARREGCAKCPVRDGFSAGRPACPGFHRQGHQWQRRSVVCVKGSHCFTRVLGNLVRTVSGRDRTTAEDIFGERSRSVDHRAGFTRLRDRTSKELSQSSRTFLASNLGRR